MPPASVPWLLLMRLLAISRLWAHAWTKMPPPPWELLVIDKPSIRDGLHWKLLGKRLWAVVVSGPQLFAFVPVVRSAVPAGNVSAANGYEPAGNLTHFDLTVITQHSYG